MPKAVGMLAIVCLTTSVFVSCSNQKRRFITFVADDQSNNALFSSFSRATAEERISLDSTSDLRRLTEDSLVNYSGVIFLQIPADTLDFAQQVDLQRFSEAGGAILFINALNDTVRNWPWLSRVVQEVKNTGEGDSRLRNRNIHIASLETGKLEAVNIKDMLRQVDAPDRPDYRSVKTERVPESNRFVVEVLDTYMYEPMEMVVFNDGRILYVERRGDVKLYDPRMKKTRVIDRFDVSITGNYEDGILGVALDPDFEKNHWIYINYSPAGPIAKQNVSRFEMRGDSIIRSTEKVVLEIPTQRETCCHSGGHLEFGPGGNLYISTGDNTSSKESDGFSPIDERAGRAPFDAQKSSSNTHDLRGKILRIHPEPDGSYTIPDGNLFPKDGSKGKPEIYVMGTRNAFRFSVDPKTGYVYWGDVGPDGGVTNERGPESYDEFNQAKAPGNYGWPYFVADNKEYADFDFATNKIGPKFNPEQPVNESPNNTGSRILPPAQKPMIWYPYGDSREFPMLGKGSRSAMAGPVFYSDNFKNSKSRFPAYYDRKLFIYEWARSWVKVVSFDEDWNLASVEPFLPGHEWYKPIDMKFGPDGSMYVLQYGANYFEHNPDSRLVKITYLAGNREPVAKLSADKSVGAAPLTVKLSALESFDADKNEELKYSWELTGSVKREVNGATATVVYDRPGIYRPVLKVTDKEGKTATANIEVKVGNEMPRVEISTAAGTNRTFYFNNAKFEYAVDVKDKEDGSVGSGISAADVFVSFDYLKEGKDLALLESNAQLAGNIRYLKGKNVLENSDCKTCHNVEQASIGPSYTAIASRYAGRDVAKNLAEKIIRGGNGNWGKNMMAAHPQHTREEAEEMSKYILNIREKVKTRPIKGSEVFREHNRSAAGGFYVIRASYTDKGAPQAGNLTSSALLTLRHPRVEAEDMVFDKKMSTTHIDGTAVTFVSGIRHNSFISLPGVDMTGIRIVRLNVASLEKGTTVELRAGSADGALLGSAALPTTLRNNPAFTALDIPLNGPQGSKDLFFVFKGSERSEAFAGIDWVEFVQ